MKILFKKPCATRSIARNAVKKYKSIVPSFATAKLIDNGNNGNNMDRWRVDVLLLTNTLQLKNKSEPRNKFTLIQRKHNARDQRSYNQSKIEKHYVSVIVKPSRAFA